MHTRVRSRSCLMEAAAVAAPGASCGFGVWQLASLDGLPLAAAGYAAPEVARGKRFRPKADVWAFGLLVCELVGLRLPWAPHRLWTRADGDEAAVTTNANSGRATAANMLHRVARCIAFSAACCRSESNAVGHAKLQGKRARRAHLQALDAAAAGEHADVEGAAAAFAVTMLAAKDAPVLGPALRDLVLRCLAVDPARRPTAAGLLAHPFYVGDDNGDVGGGGSSGGDPATHTARWVRSPRVLRVESGGTSSGGNRGGRDGLCAVAPGASAGHQAHDALLCDAAATPVADALPTGAGGNGDAAGGNAASGPAASLQLLPCAIASVSPAATRPRTMSLYLPPTRKGWSGGGNDTTPATASAPTKLRCAARSGPGVRTVLLRVAPANGVAAGARIRARVAALGRVRVLARRVPPPDPPPRRRRAWRRGDLGGGAARRPIADGAAAAHAELAALARRAFTVPVPVLRGELWAALLGCPGRAAAARAYARACDARDPSPLPATAEEGALGADAEAKHARWAARARAADAEVARQLEQDVPRCHAYHPLLGGPEGAPARAALGRILAAWVRANRRRAAREAARAARHPCPQRLGYWQGLDSVAAPLLLAQGGDEPRAFACLRALVDGGRGGLHRLHAEDNTRTLGALFRALGVLLAFHDPRLAARLAKLGIAPPLFAMPWLLTLYAHVLPLEPDGLLLWDAFLGAEGAGACVLPLFFGVGLLVALRNRLFALDASDALAFLTRLPVATRPLVARALALARRALRLTPAGVVAGARAVCHSRAPEPVPTPGADGAGGARGDDGARDAGGSRGGGRRRATEVAGTEAVAAVEAAAVRAEAAAAAEDADDDAAGRVVPYATLPSSSLLRPRIFEHSLVVDVGPKDAFRQSQIDGALHEPLDVRGFRPAPPAAARVHSGSNYACAPAWAAAARRVCRARVAAGKLYVAVIDRSTGAPLGRAFASALVDLGLPFVCVLPDPSSPDNPKFSPR